MQSSPFPEDGLEAEATPALESWPEPPALHFDLAPVPVSAIQAVTLQSIRPNCFVRSARWTPDGTAVLTTAEDHVLRVFHTVCDDASVAFSKRTSIPQPDAIAGAIWYPLASALCPEMFCFVASIGGTPVRLIDASDGRIRASYPIVDHRERFIAPNSMAFNTSMTKLYCGFDGAIEVFDVANPGYGNAERLKMSSTRRDKNGQKGIISALTFSLHSPGSYAAGSFHGSVALYDEDAGSRAVGHLDGIRGGGVTQVAYHPLDPNAIFVASRRSDSIQVFDQRNTSEPFMSLGRPGATNQRLGFDIDLWGRYLAAGDQDGKLRVWDIGSGLYSVLMEQTLSNDALSSVQFHPSHPYLLTSSGSRAHWGNVSDSESDSGSDAQEETEGPVESDPKEATLAVWSLRGES